MEFMQNIAEIKSNVHIQNFYTFLLINLNKIIFKIKTKAKKIN